MSNFYVIARQPGAENPEIPTWANSDANPAGLEPNAENDVQRIYIDDAPGAFQLLNVLSAEECKRIIKLSESSGYQEDAAVSLPRSIRHNDSFTWIIDDDTHDILWNRCKAAIDDKHPYNKDKKTLGFNARFRFYRYGEGDYFAPHTDGSWPGSKVIDGQLVDNAFGDRWSQLTILFFLTDNFEGGATQFYVDNDKPANNLATAERISIRTPVGGALCFPHGIHPQHCVHSSEKITSGIKYIIRSDVLFEL